jgi:hypothetical protein
LIAPDEVGRLAHAQGHFQHGARFFVGANFARGAERIGPTPCLRLLGRPTASPGRFLKCVASAAMSPFPA